MPRPPKNKENMVPDKTGDFTNSEQIEGAIMGARGRLKIEQRGPENTLVRVKPGLIVVEVNGTYRGGQTFYTTEKRAANLANDVDIVSVDGEDVDKTEETQGE